MIHEMNLGLDDLFLCATRVRVIPMIRIAIVLVLVPLINFFVSDLSVGQDATPTAREILQKYVQAIGGEETLSSVSTMKLVANEAGRRVIPAEKDNTSKSTTTLLRSNKRWALLYSPGTDFGFDGARYWMRPTNGQSSFREAPRYPFDSRDPVSYALHLADFPGTIDFAGKTDIGGKPAYRLKVEPAVSEPSNKIRMTPRELVFDAKTGFLLKVVHDYQTVEFADYREVDEIMVSFERKITSQVADISTEHMVTTKSIEFGIKLEDSLLSPGEVVVK